MKKIEDLSRHCAIVTGATGGIGSKFAVELAKRGCEVILIDINEDRLLETADSISKNTGAILYIHTLDLTRPGLAKDLDDFCDDLELNPDILINNAGLSTSTSALSPHFHAGSRAEEPTQDTDGFSICRRCLAGCRCPGLQCMLLQKLTSEFSHGHFIMK